MEKARKNAATGQVSRDKRGHVIELYLFAGNLEGTITPSLAELHHLKYLSLSYNDFNLTEFPNFISSLTYLEYLDLSGMNFKGKIPYELGDLFSLKVLFLSENQLEGVLSKPLELCRLIHLDLGMNNLSGPLDDFLAAFSCAKKSLKYLSLSGNQIEGPVPDLSNFASLQGLYLDRNQLNGTLSHGIGQLSNLVELELGYNNLKDVISDNHFLRLSKLEVLDLSFNHLVFNVSSDWVPSFQLINISLASCKLGPSFPIWLQSQKKFTSLDISNAEIFYTIPSWFWNHLPFFQLNLSHNHITGKIPNFSSFEDGALIDLNSNLFEGPIPSTLSNVLSLDLSNNRFIDASNLLCPNKTTILTFLDLSNNQLSGLLPDCWTYFDSLVSFSVANNKLFGKIPSSMGSLRNIEALHIANNRFGGEIPLVLNKCKELVSFDVGHNNFTGLIPSWIGDGLKKVRILILRSNMFYGNLPSSICHLSQVQVLDLSMNYISGSLPKCLNNLSTLANGTSSDASIMYGGLDHYRHQSLFPLHTIEETASLVWKGKESKYQSILGLLKSIDLSNNMLIGEIPSEVMDLVGLVSLNISRNMISGQIPTAIGCLKSLDSLDLSRNYLFGKIPSEISHIDRLSVLDLSYNNLSGEIPIGTQLQSFDASAYVGNEELCGDPLPKCLTKQTEDNQNDANSKEDEQFFSRGFYISLSIGFSTGFWGVCSFLFLNKSWRYAYFKLMSDAYDKVYVLVAICMAKLRKRNEISK